MDVLQLIIGHFVLLSKLFDDLSAVLHLFLHAIVVLFFLYQFLFLSLLLLHKLLLDSFFLLQFNLQLSLSLMLLSLFFFKSMPSLHHSLFHLLHDLFKLCSFGSFVFQLLFNHFFLFFRFFLASLLDFSHLFLDWAWVVYLDVFVIDVHCIISVYITIRILLSWQLFHTWALVKKLDLSSFLGQFCKELFDRFFLFRLFALTFIEDFDWLTKILLINMASFLWHLNDFFEFLDLILILFQKGVFWVFVDSWFILNHFCSRCIPQSSTCLIEIVVCWWYSCHHDGFGVSSERILEQPCKLWVSVWDVTSLSFNKSLDNVTKGR